MLAIYAQTRTGFIDALDDDADRAGWNAGGFQCLGNAGGQFSSVERCGKQAADAGGKAPESVIHVSILVGGGAQAGFNPESSDEFRIALGRVQTEEMRDAGRIGCGCLLQPGAGLDV